MALTREQRLSRMYAIYVLRDPRTNAVRYVGMSSNVKKRLHSHIVHRNWTMASPGAARYAAWFRELSDNDLRPILEVVSEGYEYDHDTAAAKEQKLIEELEDAGYDLLQVSKRNKRAARNLVEAAS